MKQFNDEVYRILNAAEAHGMVGSSAAANQIISAAKKSYKIASDEDKKAIVEKLNSMYERAVVPIPKNFMELIS